MIKKCFLFLIIVFILLINTHLNNICIGKINISNFFIYESSIQDYEFYNNNHSFLTYNGLIYSVNKNFLVEISRYYIPIRKIKIKSKNVLIDNDDKFLYLFYFDNNDLYKFDGSKFYFVKKLNLNCDDLKDFKVYKENFYFLYSDHIMIFDKNFNISYLKIKNYFLKIKLKNNKIFLMNENIISILDFKGNILKEVNFLKFKLISFDIDIDNKIYLLTSEGLKIFNENLKFLSEIKMDKIGDEIFFDLSRSIVIYFKNEGIKVMPPKFEYKVIKNLSSPVDLTIDEDGNIYILNSKSSDVLVYDKNLNLIRRLGDKILKYPKGIFYSNGKIYVADTWNCKIRIFNKKGELIFSFGDFGNEEFNLSYPVKVRVYNDLIYVLDMYNHKIKLFDLNGNFIKSYGDKPFNYFFSLLKSKKILYEPNEFIVYNDSIYIFDKYIYNLIIFDKKIENIKINDLITKVSNFHNNLYCLGNRWKYLYKIQNKTLIPIFSFAYNYYDLLKNIRPYSFELMNGKIYLLDKENSNLYILEGEIDE
ncbi:MAG: 6-bladed beta-propeller [Caldisericia bacterium]|nr:6-bladed beta-propeller [Caldisericia bacterium]